MSQAARLTNEEFRARFAMIEAAVQRAVRAAVLAHARAGNPVSTWRDGQVVWVQPEEILARFAKAGQFHDAAGLGTSPGVLATDQVGKPGQ